MVLVIMVFYTLTFLMLLYQVIQILVGQVTWMIVDPSQVTHLVLDPGLFRGVAKSKVL